MAGRAGKGNFLGEVRRSQVIGYGPGAIIDFRAGAKGGGPVSVVVAGLDTWNDTAKLRFQGGTDPHLITEPRLQKVLDKNHFRQPPVDDSEEDQPPERFLRGYRFPAWLLCPECGRLDYANRWGKSLGDAARWCEPCSQRTGSRVFAVPTRFVTACVDGHLDEFPWHYWIRRAYLTGRGGAAKPKCLNDENGEPSQCDFRLKGKGGSGLESLYLSCSCGARTNMAGIFDKEALKGLNCSGRTPWLTGEPNTCSETPRVLQRGASNLYFPVTYSVLSIPPWSGEIFEELKDQWASLRRKSKESLEEDLEVYASSYAGRHGMSAAQYIAEVRKLLERESELTSDDIRPQEYEAIKNSNGEEHPHFEVVQQRVPPDLLDHVSSIARLRRLREVRALTGFKRINPQISIDESGIGEFGRIQESEGNVDWLPAIEVFGEGIFVELSRKRIDSWQKENASVIARIDQLNQDYRDYLFRRTGEEPELRVTSPVEVLIHSFSHSLIKRLAFDAGYDAASLRERLYVSDDMSGVLIYTSTPDADGTLGGLERQGAPDRIESLIRLAIQDALTCASDPLCERGVASTSEALNLAACHNCLFLPETSCEHGNILLDRGLLIGDVESGLEGFFSEFV